MSFYDGDLDPVSLRDSKDTLYEALMDHRDPTQRVTLVLESDYVVRDPLYVEGRNFSHVTVLSKDEVVPCEIDSKVHGAFWFDHRSESPRFIALFDGQGTGRHGAFSNRGSHIFVLATLWHRTGFINFARRNAYAYRDGVIAASGKRSEGARAEFSGAGWDGVYAYRGGRIGASAAILDRSNRGASARFGGFVSAPECSARECIQYGAHSRRGGWVDVTDGDLRGAGKNDLQIDPGSTVSARKARYDSTNLDFLDELQKREHGLIA